MRLSCSSFLDARRGTAFFSSNVAQSPWRRRAAQAGARLKRLREEPDSYKRDEWYRNWWLADTNADIPAVVEQLKIHLGCED